MAVPVVLVYSSENLIPSASTTRCMAVLRVPSAGIRGPKDCALGVAWPEPEDADEFWVGSMVAAGKGVLALSEPGVDEEGVGGAYPPQPASRNTISASVRQWTAKVNESLSRTGAGRYLNSTTDFPSAL